MPSIATFSKILGLVICCQWMMFCSSSDGGVIVPVAADDPLGSLETARPSYDVPRSCGAEHRFAGGGLSRAQSACLLTELGDSDRALPAPLPGPLERSRSDDSSNIRKAGPSLPGGVYLFAERRPLVTVLGVAVVSGSSRDLTPPHEPPHADAPPAATQPLTRMPPARTSEDSSDAPAAQTAGDLARITTGISRVLEEKTDFHQLVLCIGLDAAPVLKRFMELFIMKTREVANAIDVKKSNIESRCNEVLRPVFKWGTIPLNELAMNGYERYPLAKLMKNYIDAPELALRRCLKDTAVDLAEARIRLAAARETGADAVQAELDRIFIPKILPTYKKDTTENIAIAEMMIKCIDNPQLALWLYLSPPNAADLLKIKAQLGVEEPTEAQVRETYLRNLRSELEEAINYSDATLAKITELQEEMRLFGAFGPLPPPPKGSMWSSCSMGDS